MVEEVARRRFSRDVVYAHAREEGKKATKKITISNRFDSGSEMAFS